MTRASSSTSSLEIPEKWEDYELLDSGDGMKRERWGDHILIRPEITASWRRSNLSEWEQWNGWFQSNGNNHHGCWKWKDSPPSPWMLHYKNLRFVIRPTSSNQVGLFPEQAVNWDWCREKIGTAKRPIKLLNLFGYTGAASIVAAAAGASVCHVDASKAMVSWCAKNAEISNSQSSHKQLSIRFIVDDCHTFIARELRRENRYDAIILDPPCFGRALKTEIWRIEDQLLSLLETCKNLLSHQPLFLMMTSYSSGMPHVKELLKNIFGEGKHSNISEVSLALRGSRDDKIIPCGVTGRWETKKQ